MHLPGPKVVVDIMSLQLNQRGVKSVFELQGADVLDELQQLADAGKVYPHQSEAVQAIREAFTKNKRNPTSGQYTNVSLVVLPTGTGKTGVGVLAAYVCRAKRVLIVTPSEAISKQQLTQFKPEKDKSLNPLQNKPFLQQREIFNINEDDAEQLELWVPRSKCVLKTSELRNIKEERYELVVTNAHKFGDGSSKGIDIKDIPRSYFSLVIVDEAHHFPAKTWKNIVDHFNEAVLILFLTATPLNRGEDILPGKKPCYELTHDNAVKRGIIRETRFIEVSGTEKIIEKENIEKDNIEKDNRDLPVLRKIKETLDLHDRQDSNHYHKAMILATDIEHAKKIKKLWEGTICDGNDSMEASDSMETSDSMEGSDLMEGSDSMEGGCNTFVQDDKRKNVDTFIERDRKRSVLVVIYRLTEGFDCKEVSVVGILRNVSERSRVYFAQFVGRAVRRLHKDDPVVATVISHEYHKQEENFKTFKECKLAQDNDKDSNDIEDEPE